AGLTFGDFVDKLKRLQEFSLALSEGEGYRLLELATRYANEWFAAAASFAKVVIYGVSPADRSLGLWLMRDEPLLLRLEETLVRSLEVARYRRAMPNIFSSQPTERVYPGFEKSGVDDGEGGIERAGARRTPEGENAPPRGDDKDLPKSVNKEQLIKQNVRTQSLHV
ncbi:MAG: hypothetical protein SGPRY_014146, partial [Prymnesium sp.]